MSSSATKILRAHLKSQLDTTRSGCTDCGACVNGCAFLGKHGTPRAIAEACAADSTGVDAKALNAAFECSLCGLCSAVCPQGLDLEGLFLELRREAVERGVGDFPAHSPVLNYERLATSRRFTLYWLPQGCSTIFFPGCSLSGTRPGAVKRLFAELKTSHPKLGIAFDCCLKPSHSLGRAQFVETRFTEMSDWLVQAGVREVLVACPNCQVMFQKLGRGLKTRTVWEALSESGLQPEPSSGTVTVHDPCVIRAAKPVHQAVRTLLGRQGMTVAEMPHSGTTTVCCGQGGAVNLLNPELAASWGELRKEEAAGRRIVTYCAGCARELGKHTPTSHLVDLLFAPEQALAGKKRGAGAPFTYLNRLRLKGEFRRKEGFVTTRERIPAPRQAGIQKRSWKPLLLLALLVAAVVGVQLSGFARYLQQDTLRTVIRGYGALAPALAGIVLVVLVSLVPAGYRRLKGNRGRAARNREEAVYASEGRESLPE